MSALRSHLGAALRDGDAAPAYSANERRRKAAAARASQMKRSLYSFLQGGWRVLESVNFDANWHIEATCNEIQFALEGWLVANGFATPRIKKKIVLRFWELGLTYREGMMLVQNLIVNIPPSSLKSRIIMVFGCAWLWLHAPTAKFACSSATDENVRRDSEHHKKLVKSAWYRDTFAIDWTVSGGGIEHWENSSGGLRMSRTFLAGFTGTHNDIILVDDPDDAHKVWSDSHRRTTQHQMTNAVENRVNNEMKCLRIVTQQRVHAEDLTAYLRKLKKWAITALSGWALFVIPMEFGKGPKDAPIESVAGWRDPRTVVGELIQPLRFDADKLADKRVAMTDHGVDAQYNQNPDIIEGGLIARAEIRFFRIEGGDDSPRKRPDHCTEERPFYLARRADGRLAGELDLDFMALTIDATFGSLDEKTASAVGALLVGGKGLRRFVFDDQTKPRNFNQTKEMIREFIRTWRIDTLIIEKKANGASIIEDIERELAEGVIIEHSDGRITREPLLWPNGERALVKVVPVVDVVDSKIGRAMTMVPEYKVGLIFVLDGAAWLEDHIKEICTFPKSKRNDRVDAMSQLQTHYRDATQGLTRAIALARW